MTCFTYICRAWQLISILMKPAQEIVFKTTEVAYAVNREGCIVAWNRAAEKVFGYKDSDALGRKCWELLCGRDPFGNKYCCEGCPVLQQAFDNKSVNCFNIKFKTASLEMKDFAVSALVLSSETGVDLMVHLCRSEPGVERKPFGDHDYGQDDRITVPFNSNNNRRGNLTQREHQVLELLADGNNTSEIASELNISTHTVRNHVQNVLFKLQVHSRLKAINLSRRLGMV